jgi:hypothetical protein
MSKTVEPESLESFIARNQLTIKVLPCGANPHMQDSKGMRHFSVTIDRVGFGPSKPMHLFFSQGSAHTKAPKLAEVLNCLASDASGVENARNFEEWAAEYGYDTDSRKAEKTYLICCEQRDQLRELLGNAGFESLLYSTERL